MAVVASIFTYGAASGAIFSAGTAATATSVGVAGGGVLFQGVMTGAISATTASIAAGVVGGVAAGFVGGVTMAGLNGANLGDTLSAGFQGALAGGITGGVAGYFGSSVSGFRNTAWTLPRVGATAASGGIASEITGGRFRDGALLSGAIALTSYAAFKMREFTVRQSMTDSRNASGTSVGFDGDQFKAGGGRFDPARGVNQLESPLGGIQGGQGVISLPLIGRIEYAPGSFLDRTVEAYSGVHDTLNNPWAYDPATGNYNPSMSLLGQHLGRAASTASNIMNWVDVPLATPIVGASVIQTYAPTYAPLFNRSR